MPTADSVSHTLSATNKLTRLANRSTLITSVLCLVAVIEFRFATLSSVLLFVRICPEVSTSTTTRHNNTFKDDSCATFSRLLDFLDPTGFRIAAPTSLTRSIVSPHLTTVRARTAITLKSYYRVSIKSTKIFLTLERNIAAAFHVVTFSSKLLMLLYSILYSVFVLETTASIMSTNFFVF